MDPNVRAAVYEEAPTVAVQQCGLDERALEAAHKAAGFRSDHCKGFIEDAIRAYLSALPASGAGWPEREDGVDEIVLPYAKFISARPELVSLLYDIDMLPEQCVTRVGAVRLAGLCEVWRKGEDGSLPAAPDRGAGE